MENESRRTPSLLLSCSCHTPSCPPCFSDRPQSRAHAAYKPSTCEVCRQRRLHLEEVVMVGIHLICQTYVKVLYILFFFFFLFFFSFQTPSPAPLCLLNLSLNYLLCFTARHKKSRVSWISRCSADVANTSEW